MTTTRWFVIVYCLVVIGLMVAGLIYLWFKCDRLARENDQLRRAGRKMQAYIAKRDKDGWERPPVRRRRNNLDQTREFRMPDARS